MVYYWRYSVRNAFWRVNTFTMKNRYKQVVESKKRNVLSMQMRYRLREGLFLVTVACAVFLFISLLTYHNHDPGWSAAGSAKVANWGGRKPVEKET